MEKMSFDLSDYMDLVTSYKCKFCGFQSPSPEGIATHLKSTHLVIEDPSAKEQQEDVLNENGEIVLVQKEESSGKWEQTLEDNKVGTEESSQASPQTISLIQTQEVEYVEVNPGNEVDTQTTSTDGSAQLEEGIEKDTEREEEAYSKQEEAPTLQDGSGEDPLSKEFFLCGNCNVGFSSMDECKSHMMQEHMVYFPPEEVTQMEGVEEDNVHISTEGGKMVNASTQSVPRKKPGRKKKGESSEEVQAATTEEYPVLEDLESHNYNNSHSTSSKRTIKAPKKLADDYLFYHSKDSKFGRKTKKALYVVGPHSIKCLLPNCTMKFKSDETLQCHMQCHRDRELVKEGKSAYICNQCPEESATWKQMQIHLWRTHQVDTDLYACVLTDKSGEPCRFKVESLRKLEIHQEIHASERSYICELCGKGFKQQHQLKNHLAVHSSRSSDDAKWFSNKECQTCGRIFANRKSLQKHIEAVHDKLRPYKCPYCSHSTARKALMELHIRTHTGDKPYKCDMCNFASGDHNSMRRHRMRHTGVKPYSCPCCNYQCIQAISLKTHMKNKHPGSAGIHCCNICSFRSVSQQLYNNHMNDHQKGLISANPVAEKRQSKTVISVVSADQKSDEKDVPVFSVQPMPNNAAATPLTIDLGSQNLNTLVQNDMGAAQLIYSALSAMAQQGGTAIKLQNDPITTVPVTSAGNQVIQTIKDETGVAMEIQSEAMVGTNEIALNDKQFVFTVASDTEGQKAVEMVQNIENAAELVQSVVQIVTDTGEPVPMPEKVILATSAGPTLIPTGTKNVVLQAAASAGIPLDAEGEGKVDQLTGIGTESIEVEGVSTVTCPTTYVTIGNTGTVSLQSQDGQMLTMAKLESDAMGEEGS